MLKRRCCHYCHRFYYPEPRCHNPKACSNPECQKMRKYDSHKRWREADPEVMEDRRKATRAWFAERSGYLKRYRASHPEYVERNRQKQRERRSKKRPVDISTLISAYPTEKQKDLFKLVPLKTDVDISIPILVQRIDLYKEYAHSPPR